MKECEEALKYHKQRAIYRRNLNQMFLINAEKTWASYDPEALRNEEKRKHPEARSPAVIPEYADLSGDDSEDQPRRRLPFP